MERKRITEIYKKNTHQYNLDKAIEELQELSLVLMQLRNKPKKVSTKDVIKEIADVKIRLPYLELIYGRHLIRKEMKKKINLILK